MKLYIVRHGKPEGAEKGPRYLGSTDMPLCEEGRKQARDTGQMIAELEPAGGIRLIASPLIRAVQTAEIIGECIGSELEEVRDDLREIELGVWDGRYTNDIKKEFPEEYEARGRDLMHYRIPEGETFAEVRDRVAAALEDIVRSSSDDDVAVIVSHAGAITSTIACLTGKPFSFDILSRMPYAGVVLLNASCGDDGEVIMSAPEYLFPEGL